MHDKGDTVACGRGALQQCRRRASESALRSRGGQCTEMPASRASFKNLKSDRSCVFLRSPKLAYAWKMRTSVSSIAWWGRHNQHTHKKGTRLDNNKNRQCETAHQKQQKDTVRRHPHNHTHHGHNDRAQCKAGACAGGGASPPPPSPERTLVTWHPPRWW